MLREVKFQNGKIYIRIVENHDFIIEMTQEQINQLDNIIKQEYGLK